MKIAINLFALTLSILMLVGVANADSPREQLRLMVEQLQGSPNDQALRERIIALAVTVNPRPATPDAATMAEGAAVYAFTHAQSNSDYSDAAKQYEKALLLAPWLATDYFNCGVAHEKAGENKEAIRSFSLYLLAAPNATDAQAIKMRIGGLQYAVQKANVQAEGAIKKEAEIRIGSHFGGGIIFYIDGTGQHGLIAATSDQGAGTWPNWYRAVQLCKDYRGGGYADWFMPSKDQLDLLRLNKDIVGGFSATFGDSQYWSSTESDGGAAYNGVWVQTFYDGDGMGNATPGNTGIHVRAIRKF